MHRTQVPRSTARIVGVVPYLLICGAIVVGISGCAVAESASPPPSPTALPTSTPTDDPGDTAAGPPPDEGDEATDPGSPDTEDAVADFQERCEQGVEDWRDGQVDYPEDLSVSVGGAVNYDAAIDIRSEPLPPGEVIDVGDGTAASEAVLVRCTVAARLTAVGDALGVAEDPNETVGGWVLQEFTPAGVVEWSWTVTAREPVDQQLRLDLRPAIVVGDEAGDLEYASQNLASFTTDVNVDASVLHRTAYWFEVNWPLIVAIATAVGVGTLAVLGWLRKLRGQSEARAQPTTAKPDEQ